MSDRRLAALGVVLFLAPFLSFFYPRVMGVVLPLGALAALGAAYSSTRQWPRFEVAELGALVLVVGLCLVSALWAPDEAFAVKRSLRIALLGGLALVFIASVRVLAVEQRRAVLNLVFFGVGVGLVIAGVSFVSQGWPYRLVRTVETPIEALVAANRAMVVLSILVWPVVLALWVRGWRLVAVGLLTFLFVLAVISQSQTSLVALVLGSAMVPACLAVPTLMRLGVQYGGALALLCAPWLALRLPAFEPLYSGDWGAASTSARIEIWSAVAQRIFLQPWIGHGLEAARFMGDWKMENLYYTSATILHPHNGPLQIWLEFGLIGALLAAGLWVLLVRRLGALQGPAHGVGLVLAVVILLVSTVSHGLWQSWWLGTVGFAAALFVLARCNVVTGEAR